MVNPNFPGVPPKDTDIISKSPAPAVGIRIRHQLLSRYRISNIKVTPSVTQAQTRGIQAKVTREVSYEVNQIT